VSGSTTRAGKDGAGIDALRFEVKDTSVFTIPDLRTRLDTLQNYFFPRLDRLLEESVVMVKEAYGIDAWETMTAVHRPNHRKTSATNMEVAEVCAGLGARRTLSALKTIRPDGVPYSFGPSLLTFSLEPGGTLDTDFLVAAWADAEFIRSTARHFRANGAALESIFNELHIKLRTARWVGTMKGIGERGAMLHGPRWHLPIETDVALDRLKVEFVGLYPLLDTTTRLARYLPSRLPELLEKFQSWYTEREFHEGSPATEIERVGTDESYRMLRAGRWWQVLARDMWTCQSCRRSTREHGVVLHVDHILPRSRGGTDELRNLQTLCLKCNLGKSNRDTTDLRSIALGTSPAAPSKTKNR
jgi:5-methylcytosine-specific restriction endonuclease McrA